MPITKQAVKKMKSDRRRTARNAKTRQLLRNAVKLARTSATAKNLSRAFTTLDKAVKSHVIHINKSSRLKRRLAKLVKK